MPLSPQSHLYCCWESSRDDFDPAEHIIGIATIAVEPFEVDGIVYDIRRQRTTVSHIRPMIELLRD